MFDVEIFPTIGKKNVHNRVLYEKENEIPQWNCSSIKKLYIYLGLQTAAILFYRPVTIPTDKTKQIKT